MSLLLRFYEPNEGKILINGINIIDFDIGYLRSQFGVVGQEPAVFNASFRDMMSRTSLISHTVTPFYWASRNPNIGGGTILNNNRFWCGNTIKATIRIPR